MSRPHTTHVHFRVTCSVPDEVMPQLARAYRKAYDSDLDEDWTEFHNVADDVVGLYASDIEPTNDDVLLAAAPTPGPEKPPVDPNQEVLPLPETAEQP